MNLSRSSVLAVAIAAAGVLGLPACAQPDPCNAVLPDSPTGLVWPASPETARVAYVGVLQDNNACQLGPSETPLNLSYPKAIAASPDGRVFVSDRAGVRAIDPKTGHMSVFADKAQSARGIAVAPDGRVFIADNGAKEVFVYSKDGKLMAEMGAGDLQNPQGVAIDVARQRLYVADSGTSSIRSYGLDGSFLSSIESTTEQPLGIPTQVAVNSRGELFVVHQGTPKVVAYDADGKLLGGFGTDGMAPGQFVRPKGLAIDSQDHVYVSDAAFDNIQIFDRQGQLLLFLGQGGNGKGEFNLPFMMTFDKSDRLYVAEYGNHRVQVLQYLGNK